MPPRWSLKRESPCIRPIPSTSSNSSTQAGSLWIHHLRVATLDTFSAHHWVLHSIDFAMLPCLPQTEFPDAKEQSRTEQFGRQVRRSETSRLRERSAATASRRAAFGPIQYAHRHWIAATNAS